MATGKGQLKAWFRRGLKPDQAHFYAIFDSFFHKTEDQIPVSSVENLTGYLNGKYSQEDGDELEKRVDNAEKNIEKEQEFNTASFKQINKDIDELDGKTADIIENLDVHERSNDREFGQINNEVQSINQSIQQIRTDLEGVEQGTVFVKHIEKGVPGGIATLNAIGKISASQLPKQQLLDTYESQSIELAPTAAALNRLYLELMRQRIELSNEMAAIEDLLQDSQELGVSVQELELSGAAQEQIIYIKTSGVWTVSNIPDWIIPNVTGGTGNGTIILSFVANPTENNRVATLTINNAYGKSKNIIITQQQRILSYEYALSSIPAELVVSGSGDEQQLNISSIRRKYLNGVFEQEESVGYRISVSVDWITIDGNKLIVQANPSETGIRETTIVIAQDIPEGKTIELPLLQGIGLVEYRYSFSVSPDHLEFANTGETKPLQIISQKQKLINGVESGELKNVGFDHVINGVGFSFSGTDVIAQENQTELNRTGFIQIRQSESNKKVDITLNQAAGVITWEYGFDSPNTMDLIGFGESKPLPVSSIKQKNINGKPSGEPISVEFYAIISESWLAYSNNTVTVERNLSGSFRPNNIRLIQHESEKQISIAITQSSWNVTFIFKDDLLGGKGIYDSLELWIPANKKFSIESMIDISFNGEKTFTCEYPVIDSPDFYIDMGMLSDEEGYPVSGMQINGETLNRDSGEFTIPETASPQVVLLPVRTQRIGIRSTSNEAFGVSNYDNSMIVDSWPNYPFLSNEFKTFKWNPDVPDKHMYIEIGNINPEEFAHPRQVVFQFKGYDNLAAAIKSHSAYGDWYVLDITSDSLIMQVTGENGEYPDLFLEFY